MSSLTTAKSTQTPEFAELKNLCLKNLFIINEGEDSAAHEEAASFFDDYAIERYLRARSNNVKAAYEHIQKTFKWRVKNQPLQIYCSYCIEDRHSHSLRLVGMDQKTRRPVIYSCMYTATRRNNLKSNMEHMTRTFEDAQLMIKRSREEYDTKAKCNGLETEEDKSTALSDHQNNKDSSDLTPASEQWVVFFDLYGFGILDCDPRTAVYTAHLLTHYPERLSLGVVVDAPWGWSSLWGAISPILDERTRKKIVFVRSNAKPEDKDSVESVCGLGKDESQWMRNEIDIQRNISKPEDHSYWQKPKVEESDGKRIVGHDSRGFKSFVDTPLYNELLGNNPIYKDLICKVAK